MRKDRREQFLREHYGRRGETLRWCAEKLGVSRFAVTSWCRRAGIPIRQGGEAQQSPYDRFNPSIQRLHAAGHTATEIAGRLGIATSTVCIRLRRMGLYQPDQDPRAALSSEQRRPIVALYQAGQSTKKISHRFGVCHQTVARELQRAGCPARPHRERARKRDVWNQADQIVDAYTAGSDLKTIARDLRCSPSLARRVLVEAGVDRRDRRGATNPNWKQGTTKLSRLIRNSEKMRNFRAAVFARDNYTCQISGEHGVQLAVHHNKVPFATLYKRFLADHPDLDPVKNATELSRLANQYEPFWELKNCITVSQSVHERIHWTRLDEELVASLYRRHGSCQKVAELVGSNRQRVAQILKRAGIELRQGRRRS